MKNISNRVNIFITEEIADELVREVRKNVLEGVKFEIRGTISADMRDGLFGFTLFPIKMRLLEEITK